ncbi:MAG: hypothetical protein ACXACY_25305 [Candidatus Hodarchaeales archaeon]
MSKKAADVFRKTFFDGLNEFKTQVGGDINPWAAEIAEGFGLIVAKKGEKPPEGYVLVTIKDDKRIVPGEYFIKKEVIDELRQRTRGDADDDDFFYSNDEISS